MRIAVIGAGGVGGYYGTLLQMAGHDVTFVARGAHLAAIREGGLRVVSVVADPVTLRARATDHPEEIGPVDLVLFTVKAYDTPTAAAMLPPLLHDETAILTLQNGVESVDLLASATGRAHVLGGLCHIFAMLVAPGLIRHTGGPRRIIFGELDGHLSARAVGILQAIRATGVPVELSAQILVDMWEKYIFIGAQGGMTALTRLSVGAIRSTPETLEMYLDVADEIAAVGRGHGIPIPPGERDRVRRFAESLEPESYSSLYHDLVQGRRTELEALLGNAVRLGERYSVPTPACRAIYAALRPYDVAAQGKRALGVRRSQAEVRKDVQSPLS